jgi:hypothetical protein
MQYSTDNKIGPNGAQLIADALKINQSINSMNLYGMTLNHPLLLPIPPFLSHQCHIPQGTRLALMVLDQLQMHSRSINPSPTWI